jgi:hypothetical protein
MKIPEPPKSLPNWVDFKSAKLEQKNWQTLDEIREKNDGRWLSVYGLIVIFLTLIFSILFISSLVVWSWHYLAPSYWTWLSSEQLSKVQSVLFSGGMGAIVSTIVQKQLSK